MPRSFARKLSYWREATIHGKDESKSVHDKKYTEHVSDHLEQLEVLREEQGHLGLSEDQIESYELARATARIIKDDEQVMTNTEEHLEQMDMCIVEEGYQLSEDQKEPQGHEGQEVEALTSMEACKEQDDFHFQLSEDLRMVRLSNLVNADEFYQLARATARFVNDDEQVLTNIEEHLEQIDMCIEEERQLSEDQKEPHGQEGQEVEALTAVEACKEEEEEDFHFPLSEDLRMAGQSNLVDADEWERLATIERELQWAHFAMQNDQDLTFRKGMRIFMRFAEHEGVLRVLCASYSCLPDRNREFAIYLFNLLVDVRHVRERFTNRSGQGDTNEAGWRPWKLSTLVDDHKEQEQPQISKDHMDQTHGLMSVQFKRDNREQRHHQYSEELRGARTVMWVNARDWETLASMESRIQQVSHQLLDDQTAMNEYELRRKSQQLLRDEASVKDLCAAYSCLPDRNQEVADYVYGVLTEVRRLQELAGHRLKKELGNWLERNKSKPGPPTLSDHPL